MPRDSAREATPQQGVRQDRRRLRFGLLMLGPLVAAALAGYFYLTGGRIVSTDDAYVRYDKVQLSSDVPGRVVEVAVREHDAVTRGQLLFRIDPEPYRIALARADSLLAGARDDIQAMRASLKEKQAQLKATQSALEFTVRDLDRQQRLAAQNIVAAAKLDEARRNHDMAHEQVTAMQQDIAQVIANLGGTPDLPIEQNPRVRQAQAARDQAALDLRHTEIAAPADGVVANLELRPGQYVQAGLPMCSLVESGSLYIEANLKETDLTYLRTGHEATVTVDAYPGRVWHAAVASISPGTGSEFSLLPAQNATGNWVKIVQRVPVRLRIEPSDDVRGLRAGMSVNVDIDTRHENPLPGPVAAALALVGGRR